MINQKKDTEAVFFDLDGTLIDTAPDMGGALNTVLKQHNRNSVDEQTYRPQVSHGSIALLKLGFPELQNKEEFDDLRVEFLNAYEQEISLHSQLFPQMEIVLSRLEAHGMPWGIITNKPEYLTHKLLIEMGIFERCCSVISADTASHAKPHPAPMLLACDRASVSAQGCLYVGDAKRDIDAGNAAGMTTLVAGWGYLNPDNDNPAEWQADAILKSPLGILNHVYPLISGR